MSTGTVEITRYECDQQIGQRERATQDRVVRFFRSALGYQSFEHLDAHDNPNIVPDLLRAFLLSKGYEPAVITRAIAELQRAAGDTSQRIYDRNRAVYELLRYGVRVRPDVGETNVSVHLIDWTNPDANDFVVAEEVSVASPNGYGKRPDVVLYVNGIALGVLELKRSTVSVAEGIRQNLDSQKKEFIEHFFSTVQFVMAGNDTEGLRYGTVETKEKYYLTWKEDGPEPNMLDRALRQVCGKERFLELIHDFLLFDGGVKKLCRHNQYFGIKEAQKFVRRREGGIIWHTQGSGKSLTMVWLAKWVRENVANARVLIVTDRTELDEQIAERVFAPAGETIYRATSGADLIATLNQANPWLICSLIHKFAGKDGDDDADVKGYIAEMTKALPTDFRAKGDLFVFVDECHRTQSGDLHKAMKAILPTAVFIGFTGTPLLKADKATSLKVFGPYIHTYKFNEAVRDAVILDLRYEARDIDQWVTSQERIDEWFELNTKGMTPLAQAQLKQRWGTLRKVLSSKSRLEMIVADIWRDMKKKARLADGRGNAILVSGSIYQACRFYELFSETDLKGKCAIVTSYQPTPVSIKGEETGEGLTEKLRQYDIYRKMLTAWFSTEPPEEAVKKAEQFEKEVKKKFIDEPGQMKLLIVVNKLLTGFDAPRATYLYIDQKMDNHGLFQAICRVNRLDGEDKEYGYIVDYKDLFKSLTGAVRDYTTEALSGYDPEDVAGLLSDRLDKAKERLKEALEAVRAVCEGVEPPKDQAAYFRYFSAKDHGDPAQLKANEPRRLALYKLVASLIRAYANVADEMAEAGYTPDEAEAIRKEVEHYQNLRDEVKWHSGDAIDLKAYEPAMRHLIDTYIRAEESRKVSAFDNLSLVQLILTQGLPAAVGTLPEGMKGEGAVAEAIENNVRRLIIEETPINPKYYEKLSALLDALIAQRKAGAIKYEEYLKQVADLARKAADPNSGTEYPPALDTSGKRALFDNLGRDEVLAVAVDAAVLGSRQADWRGNKFKKRQIERVQSP